MLQNVIVAGSTTVVVPSARTIRRIAKAYVDAVSGDGVSAGTSCSLSCVIGKGCAKFCTARLVDVRASSWLIIWVSITADSDHVVTTRKDLVCIGNCRQGQDGQNGRFP